MKNVVFWNVTPCDSCMSQHFGGTYCLLHQGVTNRPAKNVLRLLVIAIVHSSPILVTLMGVIRFSETSVLATAT
jgi:hypothetical protein